MSASTKRFADQVVVVTGSSQSIGRVTAQRFAEEGARVAVVASADLAKAQRVVDQIVAAGGVAKAFVCNVRVLKEVRKLIADVVQAFGTVDILVNSAGVDYPTFIGETTESDFDQMVEAHLKGTYFAIDTVVPIMKAKGRGKIVNVSAQCSFMPTGGMALYCAVKGAINNLTRGLVWELAPHGININCIAPGNTVSPEHAAIMESEDTSDMAEWFLERTPSKRKYSTPEDTAGAILFLCSEEALGMHGSILLYDEGMAAGWNGVTRKGRPILPPGYSKRPDPVR